MLSNLQLKIFAQAEDPNYLTHLNAFLNQYPANAIINIQTTATVAGQTVISVTYQPDAQTTLQTPTPEGSAQVMAQLAAQADQTWGLVDDQASQQSLAMATVLLCNTTLKQTTSPDDPLHHATCSLTSPTQSDVFDLRPVLDQVQHADGVQLHRLEINQSPYQRFHYGYVLLTYQAHDRAYKKQPVAHIQFLDLTGQPQGDDFALDAKQVPQWQLQPRLNLLGSDHA